MLMCNRSVLLGLLVLLPSSCFGLPPTTSAQTIASAALLPSDPNNVCGTFDNGVQYIIRAAENPPGKVSLELHVRTGALNETEEQNGLAHFVEHMAFKGSDHFEPMKLIPLLSHLGMTFGADTNAHTNETETVYKLTMPDNKPETVNTALTIFSDYANGLKFYPVQIDSERRVILEEARTRKSAAQRLNKQMLKELFPGARLVTHDIIGKDEQIKTFPQSAFLDYWNTWYRPENMTLIVAGDIDPQAVIASAKEKLGSFKPRAPAREPQTAGIKPSESARAIVLSDPEQITAKLSIDCFRPPRGHVETVSQYRRQVIEDLAQWMVNRRITAEIARGSAPFHAATVGSEDLFEDAFDVSAEAEGEAKDWRGMLDAMISQISSAIDHGFTSQEIDLASRGMLAGGEWAVKTESTRDSKGTAEQLATLVGSHSPILSAEQKLDLTRQVLSTLTKEELQEAFKNLFDTRNYSYVLLLPSPKEGSVVPGKSDVLAAASAAWAKKSVEIAQTTEGALILPSDPTPGTVSSQKTDEQLGVTSVVFENGVVMHHKFLGSQKDQVSIQITLPGGPIEETADTKGLSALAAQILNHPATHRLSSTQIRDLMIGENVQVQGGFNLDSLRIGVAGSPGDLPVGLQLVNALLTDGLLEQPAVDEWKKAELDAVRERAVSASGQLGDALSQTLGGGDIRLSPLTADMVNHVAPAAAQKWFNRIAGHSAIEVAIVGDMPAKQAIELIGRYLGSLPRRTGTFNDLDSLRKLDRSAGPFTKTVQFSGVTPKAVVLAGFVGCGELNLDRRPLAVAATILTDRMIERIRVEDNLVYSINCTSTPGQGIPGLGQIVASAPTDPKNADRLAATIIEMIKALADLGPTDLELETAKNQVSNTLDTQMKEAGFWLAQLSQLDYHKHKLEELHQIPGVFQTFAIHDIRDVLSKYAVDQGEIRLAAIPKSDDPSSPATQPSVSSTDSR
jgi:zinc protease